MKKAILLSAVILLTGCTFNSTSIESAETSAPAVSAETSAPEELISSGKPDRSPAGISVREISPLNSEKNGVSLSKGEYDDIMEMVNFDGEFVPLEELGYDVYYADRECWGFPVPDAFDKELIYTFEFKYMGDTGGLFYWDQSLLSVNEYNILTGESESIPMPEGCTDIIYIDREYILYYISSDEDMRFYQIDRASGETVPVSGLDDLFQPWKTFWGGQLVRCGDYLFFDHGEYIVTEDGRYREGMELITRYSLTRHTAQTAAAAELLGSVGDSIITAPVGGALEQLHYTLDTVEFYFSADLLRLDGELIGYVSPTDRSPVFGERYEIGRLLPSPSGNVYKPVLTTNYGTTVTQFLLTESAAAAVEVEDPLLSPELLIIDTKNKKAAAVPRGEGVTDCGYIACDGTWIYFSRNGDDRITAINTANQG